MWNEKEVEYFRGVNKKFEENLRLIRNAIDEIPLKCKERENIEKSLVGAELAFIKALPQELTGLSQMEE